MVLQFQSCHHPQTDQQESIKPVPQDDKKGAYPSIEDEVLRMRWAADFLPVPPILEVNLSEHIPWMITEEIRGKDGTHPKLKADPIHLVKMLADALSRFHQVPVDKCPFNFRLETALRHSKLRLKSGLIEPKVHFHPEFQHLSAKKAVEIRTMNVLPMKNWWSATGTFAFPTSSSTVEP